MAERYTRNEVGRILGVSERRLRYWEKLRLVRPRARWGQRFYSFPDLVAVDTIKRLTEKQVPARLLRRALAALEKRTGHGPASLSALRLLAHGRKVAATAPEPRSNPIEPLSGQLLFLFEAKQPANVRRMTSRTAEEWFEFALLCDAHAERLSESVEAYRRVVELAPDWVEAHINLGVALYQLSRLDESEQVFRTAVRLDPRNVLAQFNLGCALDELGAHEAAIRHFRRTVQLAPDHADGRFNLALAYEKRGDLRRATAHWSCYLRYEPHSPWADYARSRLEQAHSSTKNPKPIPFRSR